MDIVYRFLKSFALSPVKLIDLQRVKIMFMDLTLLSRPQLLLQRSIVPEDCRESFHTSSSGLTE